MSDCRKCVDFEWCRENEECGLFKPKTMTNADRIRAMTDEELADEILRWFNWLNAVDWDDKRIINWLKQKAEDEP